MLLTGTTHTPSQAQHTLPQPTFQKLLQGENAFYKEHNYRKITKDEANKTSPPPTTYTWNTESKLLRVVKRILSLIIFPIAIYQFLHALAGKILLPASIAPLKRLNYYRGIVLYPEPGYKYKRIAIEVDGYKIDAMIIGNEAHLGNGRWLLSSDGNAAPYELRLANPDFLSMLNSIHANSILFNYPGVGASSGFPNRSATSKAYRAILSFLEDKEKGIGAKEIIGYGISIGGGVQGDALKTHVLKEDISYVFVKDRTFADLSKTAANLTCKPLGWLVKLLGWNLNPLESSKNLQAPEIILQSEEGKDQVIREEVSLYKALSKDPPSSNTKNKEFIRLKLGHNDGFRDNMFGNMVAPSIERLLRKGDVKAKNQGEATSPELLTTGATG